MKVGILGTGDVGKAIAKGLLALGHEVMIGARSAGSEKATAVAAELGAKAVAGSFAEAAAYGEVVVLATLGSVNEQVIAATGADNLTGKVVLDTTNPLDFTKGFPPSLLQPKEGSGAQAIQALAPGARVLKVFKPVRNALMFRPELQGGAPTMFLCGNDEVAKATAAEIVTAFGWEPIDVGTLAAAHWLEAMCMVWVAVGARSGRWDRAFKLVGP